LTEAATLDRKSGEAEGSAVRPYGSLLYLKIRRPPACPGVKKFN
jgi:hypothetical protein